MEFDFIIQIVHTLALHKHITIAELSTFDLFGEYSVFYFVYYV